MYSVYIIESLQDNSFYIGSTEDKDRRLNEHNYGRTRYTKNKRPWKIVFFENYETREEAVRRERYLKRQKSKIYIKKLIKSRSFKGL